MHLDRIYALPDGERAELVDGRICYMAPYKIAAEIFFKRRKGICFAAYAF